MVSICPSIGLPIDLSIDLSIYLSCNLGVSKCTYPKVDTKVIHGPFSVTEADTNQKASATTVDLKDPAGGGRDWNNRALNPVTFLFNRKTERKPSIFGPIRGFRNKIPIIKSGDSETFPVVMSIYLRKMHAFHILGILIPRTLSYPLVIQHSTRRSSICRFPFLVNFPMIFPWFFHDFPWFSMIFPWFFPLNQLLSLFSFGLSSRRKETLPLFAAGWVELKGALWGLEPWAARQR